MSCCPFSRNRLHVSSSVCSQAFRFNTDSELVLLVTTASKEPRHERGSYYRSNRSHTETRYSSRQHRLKQDIFTASIQRPMLLLLSYGHCAIAISIASLPAIAQEEGDAEDLGVISINPKDSVKPSHGLKMNCKL